MTAAESPWAEFNFARGGHLETQDNTECSRGAPPDKRETRSTAKPVRDKHLPPVEELPPALPAFPETPPPATQTSGGDALGYPLKGAWQPGAHADAWGAARRAGVWGFASGAVALVIGRDFCSLCSSAAPLKAANSGCGSSGLDLNSGWNWHPRNQG